MGRSRSDRSPGGIPSEEPWVRRFYWSAGTAYGLVFGLAFALLAWGYDGLLLAASHADLPWAKLILGLPLTLAACCLAGWLAVASSSVLASVALWAITGAVLAVLAGRLPSEGGNLAVWMVERRLWGLGVFTYGRAVQVNAAVVTAAGAGIGALAGFFEHLAVDQAWNRATTKGRMSIGSWLALLICIPWVLLLVGAVEEQIDQSLRAPQQSVGELIAIPLAGGGEEEARAKGLSYSAIQPFVGEFSEKYVVHLVQQDPRTLASAYVDAVFDNDFSLRCATSQYNYFLSVDMRVLSCIDFSEKLAGWMDDLVDAGLRGERRWLKERWESLIVKHEVVSWLRDHSAQLGGSYEVTRAGQRGGWVFVSARFGSDFEMTCRFQGMAPVVVDRCVETSASSVAASAPEPTSVGIASLPGAETVPLADLAPEIPWLPLDESKVPASCYLGFNLARPPFDDPRVRQAFASAVDRDALAVLVARMGDQRMGGPTDYAPVGLGQSTQAQYRNAQQYAAILAGHLGHQHLRVATTLTHAEVLGRDLYGEVGLPFDPAAARGLLAQAGYPDGAGFPRVTLLFNRTDVTQAIAGAVVETWKDSLGVSVQLEPSFDWQAYQERLGTGEVDIFYMGWAVDYNDPDSFLAAFRVPGPPNWSNFENGEFNEFIDQGAVAARDPATRQALYVAAERILCEREAAIIPLLHYEIDTGGSWLR